MDDHQFLPEGPGHCALWQWFGPGRAAFLTLPRALMHAMPDHWQGRMADLLDQYSATYPNMPDVHTRVVITTSRGKRIGYPAWLIDYRHPDHEAIAKLRHAPEPSA